MSGYAEEIRAAAQALLTAEAIAADRPYRLVRDNWGWPLDTTDLPALSVFLPRETMTPDGDANAGEPSFVNDCTFGIIVSLGFAKPEELKGQLAERADPILDALLQTTAFLRLFESVERIEAETVFAKEGETFIAELQIKFAVRFRTDWPPIVPDRFESVALTLREHGQTPGTGPTLIIPVPQEPTP